MLFVGFCLVFFFFFLMNGALKWCFSVHFKPIWSWISLLYYVSSLQYAMLVTRLLLREFCFWHMPWSIDVSASFPPSQLCCICLISSRGSLREHIMKRDTPTKDHKTHWLHTGVMNVLMHQIRSPPNKVSYKYETHQWGKKRFQLKNYLKLLFISVTCSSSEWTNVFFGSRLDSVSIVQPVRRS